jgi:hypothetical protein
MAAEGGAGSVSPDGGVRRRPNPLLQIWMSLVKPLRDFGFGRTNIWEGGVGLFLIGGMGVAALTVNWVLGGAFTGNRTRTAWHIWHARTTIRSRTRHRV